MADAVRADPRYQALRDERYASYDAGPGRAFAAGEMSLEQLRDHAAAAAEPELRSGMQERYEAIVSRHVNR